MKRSLKNKLRVKRHREKNLMKKLHMHAFFLVTQMFFATEWKNQEHLKILRKFTCISKQKVYCDFYVFIPKVLTVLNLRKYISPVDSVIASDIQEIVESAKLKRSKEALTVMNTVEKILKNLGVKCNFANNMVFRPGEFQAEYESELKY